MSRSSSESARASRELGPFAGAIGQPDAHSGELPCVYVELVKDASVTVEALAEFCRSHISERAAIPKHIEIMATLPKTAVGKVLKPELRKRAIARVFDSALAEAGLSARVAVVVEDRKRGLLAEITGRQPAEEPAVTALLGGFATPWQWQG